MGWLKTNIPDFYRYNQIPPGLSPSADNEQSSNLEITELLPRSGDFAKDTISVKAAIKSNNNLDKIELYLNEQLMDRKSPNSLGVYEYQYQIINPKIELQNILKLKISDVLGNRAEKEVIIFSQ